MDPMTISQSKYCLWPPQVTNVKDLGYVEDSNGRYYTRDGGCSSAVNGHAIFQFGDTFVHDGRGNFIGVSCSNASLVKDIRKPQISTYCELLPDGNVPVNPPLIQGEEQDDNYRTTTWCLGGAVFPKSGRGDIAEGYTYFQSSRIKLGKWEELIQHTGIAKITLNIPKNQLSMSRRIEDDVLFKKSEPRFGSFSAVLNKNFIYAFGHSNEGSHIMLARVPVEHIQSRDRYEFYDGQQFQPDMSQSAVIMSHMQHGSIFRSKLFQPGTGKDWVFIGCSAFGDSTVLMGVAAKPEGPWDIQKLVPAPPKNDFKEAPFTYCMYGYPWAFDSEEGKIMVTWSEGGMRGKVVAVKVTLRQNVSDPPEPENTSHVDKFIEKLKSKFLWKGNTTPEE